MCTYFSVALRPQIQCCFAVHRNHKVYQGRGAQDGHLYFHTAPDEDEDVELSVLGYQLTY